MKDERSVVPDTDIAAVSYGEYRLGMMTPVAAPPTAEPSSMQQSTVTTWLEVGSGVHLMRIFFDSRVNREL
jgi:hypothetical protein